MLCKDIHVKLDRYFEINTTKWYLLSFSLLLFSPYNQGYLYFSYEKYTNDAIKFHSKGDRRRVLPSCNNIAPIDFGSWSELQAIPFQLMVQNKNSDERQKYHQN